MAQREERATRYQRSARSTRRSSRSNSVAHDRAHRETVATVLLVIALIFAVLIAGSCGLLDESEYLEQHAQAQQEMKESGWPVMW